MTILNKNTTNRQFVYGDFDKDKTPNVDDKYPLDKTRAKQVHEVSLAKELKDLKKYASSYRHYMIKMRTNLKANGFKLSPKKYDIKDVNSIVNKLRRKRLPSVHDIGRITILTKNPQEAHQAAAFVDSNFNVAPDGKENYFDDPHPSGRWYRAYHYNIIVGERLWRPTQKIVQDMIEIQIKTKKESKIHQKYHKKYKEDYNPSIEEQEELYREVANIVYP